MSSLRLPPRLRALATGVPLPPDKPVEEPPPDITESQPEFQWLKLRIGEEKERQTRESNILNRLPMAADELLQNISACLEAYNAAFGPGAAEIESTPRRIAILVRHPWGSGERSRIEILHVPQIPGFQVDRAGSPLIVEIGILPGDRIFYRDQEKDQYLTMEELTRRILDRTLFPKLGE